MSNISTTAACYHCGAALLSNPVELEVADGSNEQFCCDGCGAAAQWIRQAKLGDYYRLRSVNAQTVGTEPIDLSVWDRDELLSEHTLTTDEGREITLLTDGMRCAACAWLIDRALSREVGVLNITANAITGRIRITWQPEKTRLSEILATLVTLGYRPFLASGEAREKARHKERRQWVLRLGIAGLGTMQAMMMAEATYLDFNDTMPTPTRDFFRWLTFAISTPVVFYSGWPFLKGFWQNIRQRHIGMDTLIATSVLLAYFSSLFETIRGGEHVWYDAAVMFVFLLLAARMLEQRARNIASEQVDALARARPAFAVRQLADGTRQSIPVSALEVDNIVCISAGDTVPADGLLLDDTGLFEEALLTGESRPVHKVTGDLVYAGTHCREFPARIQVSQVGSATRLSQLARLVETAQAYRPTIARVADRIGSYFVTGLLLAALAVYVGWRIYDPSRAFEVTLAMLIISCPCALSLSVPAALAAAHGSLAKLGVLATRPEAMDTLSKTTDIIFDKTGTLSDIQPVLADVETFDGFDKTLAMQIASSLEQDSGHPIAVAFSKVGTTLQAEDVKTISGYGVQGSIDGVLWYLGHAQFAASLADDGRIWLGDGKRAIACFSLQEAERPDSQVAIDALRAQKLDIYLSSGDAQTTVTKFAQRLGITNVYARQTPENKLALAHKLQAQGRIVTMVGDGMNDAPVLAGADVSIALGDGAPLAQRAADLVMTGTSLMRIPAAIELSKKTQHIIRQNLTWALAYNLLALPLAAAGMVTPWIAALGMAVSSLIVTLNALRLTRISSKE